MCRHTGPPRALPHAPVGWQQPDSDCSNPPKAATPPNRTTQLQLVRSSHHDSRKAVLARCRSRTKAAARAPAPMRTARALPIVRHGATRTRPRRSLCRQRDRATQRGGRLKAIARTAASGRSSVPLSARKGGTRRRCRDARRVARAGLLALRVAFGLDEVAAARRRGASGEILRNPGVAASVRAVWR
jgi:hypothetical protein